ncbi:hypothetical protein [Stenotrophomonas nematodicola]|uniref:hypothetical protein n=1 Tax=Stenotrophomonas nematodicola TaxID=2656746 RepID=UPI003D9A859F
MSEPLEEQLQALAKDASTNCNVRGPSIVLASEIAAHSEILWLQHLSSTRLTGTADCLLSGALSAIREGTACVALGLVRPALASLRLQVDLSLGWLYFKDHPVEWERVQKTGDGFKLKTELFKYLGEVNDGFGTRFALLRECKTRTQDDPYRLLSSHIHAQSEATVPEVAKPSDVVAAHNIQDDYIKLQFECSEFISDIMWSVYASRWASAPLELVAEVKCRFKTPGQIKTFFD